MLNIGVIWRKEVKFTVRDKIIFGIRNLGRNCGLRVVFLLVGGKMMVGKRI